VAIDLPDIPESKRDTSLMDTFLYLAIHKGNVSKAFREMMADGRITQGEALDMSRVIHEMHVALAKLDKQVQSCMNK
jgi:hypothetical protein